MAIFNSYVKLPEGICWLCPWTTAAVSRLTNQPTFVGELWKDGRWMGYVFLGGLGYNGRLNDIEVLWVDMETTMDILLCLCYVFCERM